MTEYRVLLKDYQPITVTADRIEIADGQLEVYNSGQMTAAFAPGAWDAFAEKPKVPASYIHPFGAFNKP